MWVRTVKRCGGVLVLAGMLAGCSSAGDARSAECRWNRSACLYEGAYEPDEKAYAEEQARRLNREAVRKARRW